MSLLRILSGRRRDLDRPLFGHNTSYALYSTAQYTREAKKGGFGYKELMCFDSRFIYVSILK